MDCIGSGIFFIIYKVQDIIFNSVYRIIRCKISKSVFDCRFQDIKDIYVLIFLVVIIIFIKGFFLEQDIKKVLLFLEVFICSVS